MAIDARLAHDVWLQLIADEELYRATIDGSHAALAESRGLGPAHVEVLDAFHAEKGTRWNIENLRYRTALEVGATLTSYLPRTVRMLTNGDDNWLQDICFEYLAFHRWQEFGHHRFRECERFGAYVRDRIMKRRMTAQHLDVVLDFELAVIRLLKHTADIAPDAWTAPVPGEAQIDASVLRLGPAVELIELPVDIRAWIESGNPREGTPGDAPITLLAYVPSLEHTHKIKALGEGPRVVLEQFTGERTTAAIARSLAEDYDLERDELLALVRAWLADRVLVAALAPTR